MQPDIFRPSQAGSNAEGAKQKEKGRKEHGLQ